MTVTAFLLGIACALLALCLLGALTGLRAQRPDDFDGLAPNFDLRKHLTGPILCEGVIYGPLGRVVSRFVAEVEVQWSGNKGTMIERFRYDSGSVQDREWRIELGPDGSVSAEADDVIGSGRGVQRGPAVMMRYRIRLPESAGGHVLDMVDWMYLVENGTIINHSQFRKFGIKVAELVATLRRREAT
jgi:hypothetical protein